MEQGHLSGSESLPQPAPQAQPGPSGDQAPAPTDPNRLVLLQQAFVLEQLEQEGSAGTSDGELNRQIPVGVRRELQLDNDLASRLRRQLAEKGYLEPTRQGRKVSYRLTDAGRTYLAGLERPGLAGRGRRVAAVDEAAIADELREAQKAYLLLQLLNADNQPVSRAEANKIPQQLSAALGLDPAVANYRRARLAEQGYIRITRTGRGEQYTLTPDGYDYLLAGARHLPDVVIPLKGKTINTLVAAAREASFERERPAPQPASQQAPREEPVPSELR
jgi:DNA-binding PadR family transcriptional regulator